VDREIKNQLPEAQLKASLIKKKQSKDTHTDNARKRRK